MSPLIRIPRGGAAALGFLLALAGEAAAAVAVRIDNSSQRMRVYVDGGLAYAWPVSTARQLCSARGTIPPR